MGSAAARQKYPDFDWSGYETALKKTTRRTISLLGADRKNRRLGAIEKPEEFEEITMSDKALVTQGASLIKTAWESEEEVLSHVMAAYGHGPKKMPNEVIQAIVAISKSMGLDPAPGTGHIQVWYQHDRYHIEPGYQGYIFKAHQQRAMYYEPPREMTPDERRRHGLKDDEIGAVVELFDMERAKMAMSIGRPVTPIVGIAVWRKGMNIANGRSPFWQAQKNAIKDAIRQLGLGFTAQLPTVDGFYFDHENQEFVQVDASTGNPAVSISESVIEGEIMSAMKDARQVVQTQAVVIEESPAEAEGSTKPVTVVEETPIEGAESEVSTTDTHNAANPAKSPIIAPQTHSTERPYSPETLIARLQAITEKYSAETGGNELIENTTPGAPKQFAREVQDFFIAAGLGQRLDSRRKRFMMAVWGVESSYQVTVAMRKAFQKWVSDARMAQQELSAYVAMAETSVEMEDAA